MNHMKIVFYELKKALTSPIIIFLTLLFAGYNIFLIYDQSYVREELTVANELAKTYGVKITDESLKKFEEDLQKELVQLNAIAKKTTDKEFASVYEFLDTLRMEDYERYSEEEWAFISRLQLKEMYLYLAKNIDKDYAEIKAKWDSIAKATIDQYQLSGDAAKTLQKEFDKFEQRLDEIIETGEHKTWFFAGKPYMMHSFLFKTILKHLAIEALIIVVLATAFVTNYEFENRTHLLVYATKRGRNAIKDKLIASFVTAATVAAFLFAITLTTYFLVFDYSYLWTSSISSALNWEFRMPYMAWWDLSFLSYLLLSILLIYACLLLVSTLTFVISIFLKNSYFTVILFAAFFIICFMLTGFMPNSSVITLISEFNLLTLILNTHLFFMGNGELIMFKYYEIMTVTAWTIIAVTLYFISWQSFKKQEIR